MKSSNDFPLQPLLRLWPNIIIRNNCACLLVNDLYHTNCQDLAHMIFHVEYSHRGSEWWLVDSLQPEVLTQRALVRVVMKKSQQRPTWGPLGNPEILALQVLKLLSKCVWRWTDVVWALLWPAPVMAEPTGWQVESIWSTLAVQQLSEHTQCYRSIRHQIVLTLPLLYSR